MSGDESNVSEWVQASEKVQPTGYTADEEPISGPDDRPLPPVHAVTLDPTRVACESVEVDVLTAFPELAWPGSVLDGKSLCTECLRKVRSS